MSQTTRQLKPRSHWLYSLWKFSRPHTIAGTTLSVLGLYLIVISLGATPELNSVQLFGTWISCLCGNVYIVGLNQLEDVSIDKINKPHLPLASGELSLQIGRLIVASTGILSLLLAFFLSPFLFGMVSISLAIGTAYSFPPIRLKRYPFWAALCIFSVRGTIVNLGLFLHFSWVFKQPQIIPPPIWALTWFILVFTFAIAIFKDIPDVDGDLEYNIVTFTIQLGKETIFNLARWVLSVCYVGMILVGFLDLKFVNSSFLIFSHLIVLILMWFKSKDINLQDKTDTTSYYQFIWKLFFVEYLIFPFACLLD